MTSDPPPRGRCPDCYTEVDSPADLACPACHAARVARLRAREALPVGGASCPPGFEAACEYTNTGGSLSTHDRWAFRRGVARNGRVVRKGSLYS